MKHLVGYIRQSLQDAASSSPERQADIIESGPGLTHHNSETGSYGKFHILSKPRLLPFSFATFR